jgi:DNA-binding protein HU-beta
LIALKNKEIVQKIQQAAPTTSGRTSELLDLTASIITQILSDGDSLAIQGFGTFEVKKKDERVSVNPSTGSRWMIPPKFVASFKAGTTMKEKIKLYAGNEQ